jgi:hypothetical protein
MAHGHFYKSVQENIGDFGFHFLLQNCSQSHRDICSFAAVAGQQWLAITMHVTSTNA